MSDFGQESCVEYATCELRRINVTCNPKCPYFLPKKKKKSKVIILDNNPLSIACYMEEFGEKKKVK